MHHPIVAAVVALAGLLVGTPAHGIATAVVVVNGTEHVLDRTGFVFQQVSAVGIQLQPGESIDLSVSYSITVQDQALDAAFDLAGTGCVSLFQTLCNPPYGGHEVAQAELRALWLDPRSVPPHIQVTGDGNNVVQLQTHGDSFAESLSVSGTIHRHFLNTDISPFQGVYPTYVALWVLTDPIPEPAVAAQLICGLALVRLLMQRSRRLAKPRCGRTSLDAASARPLSDGGV